MGNFCVNGSEGRRNTHVFSLTDHREKNATARVQDTGYDRGGSSAGSGSNSVGDDVHRKMTCNCGAVGRFATNI